jgi:hypothetical protein
VIVLAVSAAGAAAKDAPDDLLLPGERVSSTLSAKGERKLIGLAGVEGSVLDVRVDAPPGGNASPRLSILAPDGTAVDASSTATQSRHHARIKALPLTSTGTWRIVVEAPPKAGGAFTVSTSAKVPSRFDWTGVLGPSASVSRRSIPAAPRGRMTVVVSMHDDSESRPVVELLAPSGAVVAAKTGARGRAVLAGARTQELGVYTVRVSGASGAFDATARVRTSRRASVRFRDVEATPDVIDYGPSPSENQAQLTLYLDGVGFSDGQTVQIVDGTRTIASGKVHRVGETGASVLVDLADVAPGAYSLVIASAGGNTTVANAPFVVVNRAPKVTVVDPREAPNTGTFALAVYGAGFDADAALSLTRAADGIAVPTTVSSRVGHEQISATASPPAFATGPCDVEVRDPGGAVGVAPGAVDLLGFRAAPVVARTYAGVDARNFIVGDAAYDETHGRVLLAVRERTSQAAFVLFDPATSAVIDELVVGAQDADVAAIDQVAVAWDRVAGTFDLCLCSQQGPAVCVVRTVSATDLHQTVSQSDLGRFEATSMTNVSVAAERDHGGCLVAWQQLDATFGGRVLAQAVSASGVIDESTRSTIAVDAYGNLGYPALAYQGGGRFVVAWAGVSNDYRSLVFRATVTDAAGKQVAGLGPYVVATSNTWAYVAVPRIVMNPDDGSALLAFSYSEGVVFRPACQRLAPLTAAPAANYLPLDAGLPYPGGRSSGLAWSPARSEFVVAVDRPDGHVVLRRVNPDGTVRAAPAVESYEGAYGLIYAGSTPDSLGFARSFDGVADDVDDAASQTRQVLVGPIR